MLDKIKNELHLYEKKFLKELSEDINATPEEIAERQDMPLKAVTSAAGMLASKDIITVDKFSTENISLSEEGEEYLANGLPEHRILKALQDFSSEGKDVVSLDETIERAGVSKQQMNFSMGILMRNRWAKIDKGNLSISEDGKNVDLNELPQVKYLQFIKDNKQVPSDSIPEEYDEVKKEFTKRKDLFNITVTQDFKYKINVLGQEIIDDGIEIQDEATQLTHEQLKTGSWKNLHYRGYDINASAPNYFPGKVHPLQQTIEKLEVSL